MEVISRPTVGVGIPVVGDQKDTMLILILIRVRVVRVVTSVRVVQVVVVVDLREATGEMEEVRDLEGLSGWQRKISHWAIRRSQLLEAQEVWVDQATGVVTGRKGI